MSMNRLIKDNCTFFAHNHFVLLIVQHHRERALEQIFQSFMHQYRESKNMIEATLITTTKATAIYNMHGYWSKKPHDAIRQYIIHYTEPEDIVLDQRRIRRLALLQKVAGHDRGAVGF